MRLKSPALYVRAALALLMQAWVRFRSAAWQIAASFGVLVVGLFLLVGLLEMLKHVLAEQELQWHWLMSAALDLVGLLLAQSVMILLVRFYDLERSARAQD